MEPFVSDYHRAGCTGRGAGSGPLDVGWRSDICRPHRIPACGAVGGEWCRLWTERFTDGDPSTSHTCVWRLGRFRDLQGHKLDLTVWMTMAWENRYSDVDRNGQSLGWAVVCSVGRTMTSDVSINSHYKRGLFVQRSHGHTIIYCHNIWEGCLRPWPSIPLRCPLGDHFSGKHP